ncbi:hypothetical protein CEXT_557711 [Caerostris extrusa]|uniref:Uncharacterized protein n=1 Tax=Caerostris extrusa TaxID=172846 RepID=A0AAV4W912_CAEEX|nr:hypothetical protein CEXT_557711 [Caerostris extrusa]
MENPLFTSLHPSKRVLPLPYLAFTGFLHPHRKKKILIPLSLFWRGWNTAISVVIRTNEGPRRLEKGRGRGEQKRFERGAQTIPNITSLRKVEGALLFTCRNG